MEVVKETPKKKHRTALTTAEIILRAINNRPQKWRQWTQHDIWKKILLKAEITDALNLGNQIVEIEKVLHDDTFWRAKFIYDFPDLVEFVGTELPSWITPGDPEADPEFRDLPWRRYYYVCRLYMRRCVKLLLLLGNELQDEYASQNSNIGYHRMQIHGTRVPGSTYMVNVHLYHRNGPIGLVNSLFNASKAVLNAEHISNRGKKIGEPVTMTIWEYCRDFILHEPHDSIVPRAVYNRLEKVDSIFARLTSSDRFDRNLETNTNIIRTAIVNIAASESYTNADYIGKQKLFKPIEPLLCWIVRDYNHQMTKPVKANIWFSDLRNPDDIGLQWELLRKLVFDTKFANPAKCLELKKSGRTLRKRENGTKYLIGEKPE